MKTRVLSAGLLVAASGCNPILGIHVFPFDDTPVDDGGADGGHEASPLERELRETPAGDAAVDASASGGDAPEADMIDAPDASGIAANDGSDGADDMTSSDADARTSEVTGPEAASADGASSDGASSDAAGSDASSADEIDDRSTPLDVADAGPDIASTSDTSTGVVTLPAIHDASHLRLWLAADRGVDCESGRVLAWADSSGHADNASLQNGQLGPRCQLATPHALHGVDLPFFSAPIGNGNIIDESLDVDLSFLANSEYTVFVVERRWADQGFFLGTTVPDQTVLACGPTTNTDRALQIGYVGYAGLSLVADQTCDGVLGPVLPTPAPPPALATYDVVRFRRDSGRQIWIGGSPLASNPAITTALKVATGGAIGRAYVTLAQTGIDARFVGDIAEVLVYDAGLDDGERVTIEQYLRMHWGL